MDIRNLYITLLKKCILDDIYCQQRNLDFAGNITNPACRTDIINGSYWPDRAHTMIGYKRMDNIQYCVETCIKENIEGDFIETGVWRGGACIFMAGILKAYQIADRKVYVCDSFEGLPMPDSKYPKDNEDVHHLYTKVLSVDVDTVKNNFRGYNLLDDQVVFIEGFFETSLATVDSNKLAILRLDGDMYSSTIQALEQLYDRVVQGGFIIIDDWALPRARAAVKDFRNQRSITDEIVDIDDTGVYWRKN
jgi:O-methyltransferase